MGTYDCYCNVCEKTTQHKLNGDCLECILKYIPPIATDNTFTQPESVPSPKGEQDGWISVENQLPEIAKQVSITLEMDGNARAAKSYPGFRANGGWYVFTIPEKSWVPHDDKHYKITHWQPLPKAPTKH